MVDVVVDAGCREVVVVLDVDPVLKCGPTTDPTNPAIASAPRHTMAMPKRLAQDV